MEAKRGNMQDAEFTSLPPDQAAALLVQTLTSSGATVLSQTPGSLTGVMHIARRPSAVVAFLLMLVGILPGVIYLAIAGKDIVNPYSIQLWPDGQGTRIHPAGKRYGLEVARQVARTLPK